MDATRQKVTDRNEISVSDAVLRYDVAITDLVAYGDVLGQFAGTGSVGDGLRAQAAFARAKAGAADQEAIAFASQTSGDVSDEQRSALIATETSQQAALESFAVSASTSQSQLVNDTVTGDAVNLADAVTQQLARGEPVSAQDIVQAYGAVVDLMRWAEQRLESASVSAAADESGSVTRQATLEAILVLLVLILAVALAVVLARSLSQSLGRLRDGALAVARHDLPEAVKRLQDVRSLGGGGADDLIRQVRDPIRLDNRDEIGQVAAAFNSVHREAVRIAAEQAGLRTSVSAMFLNLARRSQSLVDRMIGELDQIERTEEDPKRLAQLFELDHLATRMRRNDENLLVLAGADSSAPRREDAILVDALRAAQSEVELYNRVEFGTVDTDVAIAAIAVNDVVRLIAELLDNATRFSPPNTTVVADARRIRDYVVVQIEDRGLGMSGTQMDALNQRLAEPPGVDVAAFRLMGLAVVGRLASRYDIRVELRANLDGGTVAQVMLPSTIVVLPSRTLEAPSRGRMPQLDRAPAGWPDGQSAARSATATLPALAPDPWGQPATSSAMPGMAAPLNHPSLPQMPSQRPVPGPRRPDDAPTPDRPPLPTRVVKPAAPPAPAVADSALGSPTAAYPTLQPAASPHVSPDPQVAVGFVTPDGTNVPPSRPVPNGNGWGAALAAMPPAPPPPAAAPAPERTEAPIFLQMQASWFKGQDGDSSADWSMPTAGYAPSPLPPAAAAPAAAAPAPAAPAPAAPAPAAPAPAAPAPAAPAPAAPAPAAPSPDAAAPAAPISATGSPAAPMTPPPGPPSSATPARPPLPTRAPAVEVPERNDRSANGVPGTGTGQNGPRPASAGSDNGGAQTVPRPRSAAEDRWRTAADDGWQRAMAAAEPSDAGTTRSGLPKRVPQAQLVPGGVDNGPRNQNRRSADEVRGLLSAYHRGVQRGRTAGSTEAAADAPAPKEKDQ